MKLFVIGWDNDDKDYADVILGLKKRGHEIAYWVGNNQDYFEKNNKQQFNNTVFQYFRDAVNGIPPKELENIIFDPPSEDLIKQFYDTELTVQTMMRKFLGSGKSLLEMRHTYYHYLQYWQGVIKKFKPDVVIFCLWPHSGYDYVLYCLAKSLGIKTIMFSFTRVSDRLLLLNDLTIGSRALQEELERNKNRQFNIEDLSPDIRKDYQRQIGNDIGAVPTDLKLTKKKYSRSLFSTKKMGIILKAFFDFSIFKKVFFYLVNKIGPNLVKEYKKFQIIPDFDKKFVYVPLHFQPEASTSPLGGLFIDQILMIEILSAAIPDDWLIYVKENPFQWLIGGYYFGQFRYKNYYEELNKLKKVRLVPVEINSLELIRKAEVIASVTGTAGWEAVLRSKPAMVFGHAWYKDCPGIFKVESVESCQKAIKDILEGFTISKQDMINYLVSFDRSSHHGYFEEWVKKQSVVQGSELTKSFLNALIKEIEGIEAVG
ncbi:MAG: hypothetical protein HY219_01100 [Candidatus Staskawiczbacteria bacterium]|nr:hypothetical protein [Candidatus Staskawiczbacteria bacterium]